MKTSSTKSMRRRERGSIAVEAALVLPILVLFLAAPLFLARIFWYYSVSEKAAHDAARFLATATQAEMKDSASGTRLPPISQLAAAIADAELEEIRPRLTYKGVTVQCDYINCGSGVPQTVRVTVVIKMKDDILSALTGDYLDFGPDGLRLTADVTMRYAGN